MYKNQQIEEVSDELSRTTTAAFRNQFYQGKSCGLLTNKEAAEIVGTPMGTEGTIIPASSPTAASRPGNPRVDSCAHTALKSSDGYIDIVVKTYANKNSASRYYAQEISKLFTALQRDPSGFGAKLYYGDGSFHLLKDERTIELSASQTPRVSEPGTENFTKNILERVVSKL